MVDVTSVLLLLFLCSVTMADVFDAKAFYCRDPDTGKLHSINSTWPSTSFCGNYSCKLKKINVTEMEYTPLRQFNVTTFNITTKDNETKVTSDEVTTPITIEKKIGSDIQPIMHLNNNIEPKTPDTEASNDRYLTEEEIKSISEILHTVKRSDLDAIVEIYNLAQDISKEIDKQTSEIVNELPETENINENSTQLISNVKPKSYWYEPLNVNPQKAARSVDMDHQGSNLLNTAVTYNNDPKQSHYSGSSYYYPMSNFQKIPSYLHHIPSTKPCSQTTEHELINKMLKRQERKPIQPSVLLPYPFSYVHNFNSSLLNNYYYNPHVWSYYDFYKYRNYQPYANINPVPSNAFTYPQVTRHQEVERKSVSKEENDILDKLIAKAKESKLPDWQTAPLPEHVLEEVRANIEKSSLFKPLSFRKKINLERVGKAIRIEELARSKRSADEKPKDSSKNYEETYESFIEKVTCAPDTQLGYFRRGNLSRPYPECCPERIEKPEVLMQQ